MIIKTREVQNEDKGMKERTEMGISPVLQLGSIKPTCLFEKHGEGSSSFPLTADKATLHGLLTHSKSWITTVVGKQLLVCCPFGLLQGRNCPLHKMASVEHHNLLFQSWKIPPYCGQKESSAADSIFSITNPLIFTDALASFWSPLSIQERSLGGRIKTSIL